MTAKARELRAMAAVNARAAVPLAVVSSSTMQALELQSGMRAIVFFRSRRVAVWICSMEEAPQQVPAGSSDAEIVWLSRRARRLLNISEGDRPLVELHTPASAVFHVRPELVDDLPAANEVALSSRDARNYGPWAIAYGGTVGVPVRVRTRRVESGRVRMSMLTRTLALHDDAQRVRLARLDRERLDWRDALRGRTRFDGIAGTVVAAIAYAFRGVAWGIELLFRRLFHAPALAMATVEAQLGDDTNRVVRIAPETLSVLGIKAGDDVLIEWADRRVVAVAHESAERVDRSVAIATLDTWGREHDARLAKHLTIGIAAEMRGELRIPRRTVVTVRRRVTTIFMRRLNELTVPIGGLFLAAIAIKDFPLAIVGIGAIFITVFAMLPARYRVPPRGRWP